MLTKQDINFIKSLSDKKFRYDKKLFVAEGAKIVNELITSKCKIYKLYATRDFQMIESEKKIPVIFISEKDLTRISTLKSTRQVVGIFYMPDISVNEQKLYVVCDNIQDPGNLGTIIRIADWYGLQHIICSNDTVDCFNSKTVQASMGSIARVKVEYCNLTAYFTDYNFPVYAADLQGISVYTFKPRFPCALIIGNEGKGINQHLKKYIDESLVIPRLGSAESLNAAVATAVMIDRLLFF